MIKMSEPATNTEIERLISFIILNGTKYTVSQINYTTDANQKQLLSAALLPICALPLIIYNVFLLIMNIFMHQISRDRSIYSVDIWCTQTLTIKKIESVGITFMLVALTNVCLISIIGLSISMVITSVYFQAFGTEWRQTVLVVVYGLIANYIIIFITERINAGFSVMFNVLGAYVVENVNGNADSIFVPNKIIQEYTKKQHKVSEKLLSLILTNIATSAFIILIASTAKGNTTIVGVGAAIAISAVISNIVQSIANEVQALLNTNIATQDLVKILERASYSTDEPEIEKNKFRRYSVHFIQINAVKLALTCVHPTCCVNLAMQVLPGT